MPQIQVLSHQPDPVAQQIASAGNSIAQTIQQRQALELARLKYQFDLKKEESEINQHKHQRKLDMVDTMLKLNDRQGLDPTMKLNLIKSLYGNDSMQIMGEVGDDAMKLLAQSGPSADAAVKQASIPKAQAEADLYSQVANKMRGGVVGGGPSQPQSMGQPMDPMGGQEGAGMYNDAVITGMGEGGPKIEFPGAQASIRRAETVAGELGKSDVAKANLKQDLDVFFSLDDQIPRTSKGGFQNRISKGLETGMAGLDQSTSVGQVVPAWQAKKLTLRTKIAAALQPGNLTFREQEDALKMVPNEFDSEETKNIKRTVLYQLTQAADSGDFNTVRSLIKNYSGVIERPNSPKARAIEKLNPSMGTPSSPTKPQGADLSTLSDEELMAIMNGGQ